ncbi:hypothetical protein NP233_g10891 [Leucocoprinus birnbaumii]|uniref:DUF4939 domain-containing protein n=1 Tax=Leucocoprinus birnbaumii TaxID=56174 RepID=A0AAD5VHE3_9AGAR|nr:hypothetical protein NP233_g10891 [Leucocoprinus birnbaumii]
MTSTRTVPAKRKTATRNPEPEPTPAPIRNVPARRGIPVGIGRLRLSRRINPALSPTPTPSSTTLGDTPIRRNPRINRLPPSTPSSSQRANNARTPSVPGGMPRSPPSGGPGNGDDENDEFEPNDEDDWICFQEIDEGPPDGNNGPPGGDDEGPPEGDNNGPPGGNNGDHQEQGNNGPPDGDDGPPEGNNNDESSESDGPGPVRHRRRGNYEDRLATVLERFADTLDGRQQNQDRHNKARVPDVFDGSSPEKLETFITQCQLYFRSNPKSFTTDESRVNFAMTYLTGTALNWFEVCLQQEEDGVMLTCVVDWYDFVAELRNTFGVANPKEEAAEALEALTMKSGEKIANYTIQFLKHSSKLSWNDEYLTHRFYKGLPNRIQDILSQRKAGKPKTFQAMKAAAEQIDSRYWERDRERARVREAAEASTRKQQPNKSAASSSSTSASASASNQRGNSQSSSNRGNNNNNSNDSSNNSNRAASQAPSTKSANTTSSADASGSNRNQPRATPKPDLTGKLDKSGKLTVEERQRRKDKGLCGYCGLAGHFVNECRKRLANQEAARAHKAEPAVPENPSSKGPEK